MSTALIGVGSGMERRFEVGAAPAQARLLIEQAIALTGGTVLARRSCGLDFAPGRTRRPARGSVEVVPCAGGTRCSLRVGWPGRTLLRFTVAVLAAAAVALPLAAQVGPRSFAAVLTMLALFGFGRYALALLDAALASRRLALVTDVLATSSLYRAPPSVSRLAETRALVAALCAGRISPREFTRARHAILMGGL